MINREKFLQQLESVQPGLSSREIIEQSSCYVFKDGKVMTFNDEIACTQDCDIGVEGAVRSGALLAILRKLPEEELEIRAGQGEIVIAGTRRECGITCEKEIQLPISSVERPDKWLPLEEDFKEAVELVQHCASSDESQFALTCVHITPDFIEACDNAQMTRVKVATKVRRAVLVRRDSIRHVTLLGMTKFCETDTWIHFKSPSGLVLSCRRFVENYHDLTALLKVKGQKIHLPKGLGDAADKAAVFAQESDEKAQVMVELRPGKLRITGVGASGWYRERKELKYAGPPLSFMIAPLLLMDITKKYNEAEITEGRLRVDGGKWVYVSCLAPVHE
jgi:DNA polymerase III sliding clamp (beta) subunit (PCNA family)